ncbi:methylated-DNA--[protein]-cysteine S-methyltransferase [Yersinia ruckeri]|uniref:methylated-DNA--[protein]-cysteine S-methyltransferase n=1 Tax=Yersinia ruckeri TaxID=29486 RepID=UPI0020BF67D6|nr:methylated-DNA--[protein]-cysteine S-methyltransferase [Yersinia ruckeri]MCW6538413.1 methylated-DNA--[protein]-cysteine S-methyltransferase [Yersinia ruckeri]MCW6636566.1 methylated-DNA--[protein]-cysteine S-methyltransferase [Yersinia ruckeri]UZX66769.1 methylated-DNA--[protein]-cysteine S-methyltransferase [Yersinia ruckeri]UZX69943.1 methylated-DNA--[protein]-cysteine S-methyltransferase [Yersinia ruckeri]UZY09969.1 methylated-DNA--[protein]-cysteine S-methyltransferase [Yersinia rucker
METFYIDQMPTPQGELVIICDEQHNLRAIDWVDHYERLLKLLSAHNGPNTFTLTKQSNSGGLTEKMQRYFAGELTIIDTLPVKTAGTPFQRQVWQELRNIPCGTTISYGELARRIGRPTASRAVGMANGLNPISIVVPCHRVIGASGTLTGYAGGIERKRGLLVHEGYLLAR